MSSKGIILSLCDFSGAWSRPFVALGYTVVRVDPMHDAGRMATEGTRRDGTFDIIPMADGGTALAATAGQLADWLEGLCFPRLGLVHRLEQAGVALPYTANIVGILMAPPCTHFAGSGARWWAGKDARGETDEAVAIVRDCLRVKDLLQPRWWALENPAGRIARLVPELQASPSRFVFHPCDFALLAEGDHLTEAYTKRTVLWGNFTSPMGTSVDGSKVLPYRAEPVMIERKRKDGSIVRGSWMWAHLGGKSERTKALRSKTPTGFARAFALAQESNHA